MNSIWRNSIYSNQIVYLRNKLIFPATSSICVRHMHLFNSEHTKSHQQSTRLLRNFINCDNNVFKLNSIIGITSLRFKSNKKESRRNNKDNVDEDEDDDDDDEDRDSDLEDFKEGYKTDKSLTQLKVQTLRMDTIIKAGLGISKNKIEKLFYKSNIRLNGKKVQKKSINVNDNDEIDIVHGVDEENEELLNIGRIEVLSKKVDMKSGLWLVIVRRFKTLKIENYSGSSRYSRSSDD